MDTKFIKIGDRYLVEGSNAIYVNEVEMKKIIKDNKALADITSNECQGNKIKEARVQDEFVGTEPTTSNAK